MTIDFSQMPCRACGWRHQLDAFKPNDRVRTLVAAYPFSTATIHAGESGLVTEWSQYGGPVYVRVQFANGERENFAPCELEHEEMQMSHPAPGATILFHNGKGSHWHQTKFPGPCGCGIEPTWRDRDFVWRLESAGIPNFHDAAAPCVVGAVSPSTQANAGGFTIGDAVKIDDKNAHLYESFGTDLYVEGFGRREEDGSPIVKFKDAETGVYGYAPPAWLRHRMVSIPESEDSLRAMARTLLLVQGDEAIATEVLRSENVLPYLEPHGAALLIVRLATEVLRLQLGLRGLVGK